MRWIVSSRCRQETGCPPRAWLGGAADWRRSTRVVLLLIAFFHPGCNVFAQSYSEADLRAVFLLNFPLFIDWPDTAFESSSSQFRYCVVGSQVLSDSLKDVLAGETLGQRRPRLIAADDPAAWRRCHILYLDSSISHKRRQILSAVKDAPVLTIGDSDAFARSGGMIALVRKGGKLRAVINRATTERAGICISSKLLRLAILVSGESGR